MKQLDLTASVGPQQPNHPHDVRKVQSQLNRHAHATHITVPENGICDWETLRAIHAFQRRVMGMLLPDEVVPLFGATNWHLAESFLSRLLSTFPVPPSTTARSSQLTAADYAQAAANLKCEVAAIQAVADVESGGRCGFDAKNRPVILYERSIFSRLTKHAYDKTHPDISGPHAKGEYPSGSEAKYLELERAYRLSPDAALESASWGAFQILGENYKAAGFDSVGSYVAAMCESVQRHLNAFVQFILADPRLQKALQSKDWKTFARIYNGPNYAKYEYDIKVANAYAKESKGK